MSTAADYKHRPLRYPDSIRLCRVLPRSNAALSIQIGLSSYRLSDPKLKFTALSYTRGDSSDKVRIPVGGSGTFLQVPRSSVEALTALRLHGKRQLFWIDAICINQSDLREKTSQVRLMARIFGTASCTTIYLGPHTESSKIVFEEVSEALHAPKVEGTMVPDRDRPNYIVVQGLEDLIQRPWFRRVWVLQEAVLSKNLQVLCGDSLVPQTTLLDCFYGYAEKTLVMRMPVPFVFRPWVLKATSHVVWHSLWECLYYTRDSMATDPRDKLFALKAFLVPLEDDTTHPSMADFDKMINYETSIEEILETLALAFLQFIGLRLLVGVRHAHNRHMPSWMPDWSQNLPLHWRFFTNPKDNERYLWSLQSETSSIKYQVINSRILSVQGWRCGQICEMGQTYVFADLEDAARQLSRIVSVITIHGSSETIQKETLNVAEVGLSQGILKVLQQMGSNKIAGLLTRYLEDDFTIEGLCDMDQGAEQLREVESALQSCRIVLCGPSYIAIAPCSAMEGDVLVVIEGAPSPCLVRPSFRGTWSVVSGDCFALPLGSSIPLEELDGYTHSCGETTWEALRNNLGEPEVLHLS